MKNYLFIAIFAFLFISSPMNAAIYKGHRVFTKVCNDCHGSGVMFVSKKTISQWKKMMKKKGEKLSKLHLKSKKAKASWKYFKSKKFTRKTKHLKDFLLEYAKDSGNVPACN